MDNKEEKKEQRRKERGKKRIKQAVIISVCAVLLITGIAAGVKTADYIRHRDTAFPDTNKAIRNSEYTYAVYGKGKLPEEFVEMLYKAQEGSKAACEKYGTALEIGKRVISKPEMEMNFYDKYSSFYYDAEQEFTVTLKNSSGFPLSEFPEDAEYKDGKTWAEYIMDSAVEELQDNYRYFDLALENGFVADDETVKTISDQYEAIQDYGKYYQGGADELIGETYPEGVTYELIAGREIVRGIADAYTRFLKAKSVENLTEEEAKALISGRENEYKVFCGRIYVTKDPDAFKTCKSEEDYLKVVEKQMKGNKYGFEADSSTNVYYNSYDRVKAVAGKKTADYLFSADRKAGEISVFSDSGNDIAIYVDRPAFFSNTVTCTMFPFSFNSSKGTKEQVRETFEDDYNNWVKGGGTKDYLVKLCDMFGTQFPDLPLGDSTINCDVLDREFQDWLRADERKEGDTKCFIYDSFGVMVYFERNNRDDPEWFNTVAAEQAEKLFEEHKNESLEEYTVKRYDEVLEKSVYSVHPFIEDDVSKYASLIEK